MITYFCCGLAVLALAWFKPAAPVWAGVGLVMLVAFSASYNLSAPSAKYRRLAVRRMGLLTLFGISMIVGGVHCGAVVGSTGVGTPEAAKSLMLSLLVYCGAMLGAPVAAWAYMSYPKCRKMRRVVVRKNQVSLSKLVECNSDAQIGVAV